MSRLTKTSEAAEPKRPVLTAKIVAPYEPRWLVLVMLFVLMGALAVPMLWRSPYFSPGSKRLLTFVAILQTIVVLAIFGWVFMWFLERVSAVWSGKGVY
ncbi:MAG: hypothetical protein JW888_07760 [Pirellulales bacterium]|nr:hypothetical protein [Pirellulales bacterium]